MPRPMTAVERGIKESIGWYVDLVDATNSMDNKKKLIKEIDAALEHWIMREELRPTVGYNIYRNRPLTSDGRWQFEPWVIVGIDDTIYGIGAPCGERGE